MESWRFVLFHGFFYWKHYCIAITQLPVNVYTTSKFNNSLMHTYCNFIVNKFQVEVLLVRFRELSGVPFLLNACNEACQGELEDTYGQRNVDLQRKLDAEYDESIKQAQREMGMDVPVTRPHHRTSRRRQRTHRYTVTPRRKRCSIM